MDDFQTAQAAVLGTNALEDYTFWHFLLCTFVWSNLLKFFRHGSMQHGSKLQRRSSVLGQGCSSFVDELSLIMSPAAGFAGYPVGQSYDNDHGMINLDVRTLTGEEFRLRVERSTLGSEVRTMVLDNLPVRSGAKLVLHQASEQVEEAVRLKLHQTLQEQGLAEAETAILCCTYVPTQLQAAWCFLMGRETSEAEVSLEGVTHLTAPSPNCLLHLPRSLVSLTFTGQSLNWGITLPASLTLPNRLQSLTFGDNFNQSLDGVTLPKGLQNLTFGRNFNQSLEGVTWPSSLQSLTFGVFFDQSLDGVTLPNSLQNLTFGFNFN